MTIAIILALWLVASFPLGILVGRVIRNANARENAAEERGEGLGVSFIHNGNK